MRTKCRAFLWASLCGLMTVGCGPKYVVNLDTYVDPGSHIPQSASVAVITHTDGNAMLGTEVERKLSFLLSERGYRVVSDQASADYALLAVFGIGEPTTQYLGTVMMPVGGMLMSVPRSRTTHLRWMVIGAVDAETAAAYQAGDQIDWSWFAEVYSAGSSNDLRSVVDFMLVEAIELFPRSTGRAVAATVNESDRRVRELREWMNGSD